MQLETRRIYADTDIYVAAGLPEMFFGVLFDRRQSAMAGRWVQGGVVMERTG